MKIVLIFNFIRIFVKRKIHNAFAFVEYLVFLTSRTLKCGKLMIPLMKMYKALLSILPCCLQYIFSANSSHNSYFLDVKFTLLCVKWWMTIRLCVTNLSLPNHLSIVERNSSFDIVFDILSFRNSMASIGVMSAKWFLNAQTLANVRSSTRRSSRRVPEATMSMAG